MASKRKPSKPTGSARTRMIAFMATEAQQRAIYEHARRRRMSAADLFRSLVLKACVPPETFTEKDLRVVDLDLDEGSVKVAMMK